MWNSTEGLGAARRWTPARAGAPSRLHPGYELPTSVAARRAQGFSFRAGLLGTASRFTVPAASIVFALGVALSTDAQAQCITSPVQSNQTCTNSVFLTGGPIGLSDTDTLIVTNTNTGTITGATTSGTAYGIQAVTATVTNSGTITASTTAMGGGFTQAFGINATTATVTNSGTIAASATGGAGAEADGISAGTATVTNSGTIAASATATGGSSAFAGGILTGTIAVTNSGTIAASATAMVGGRAVAYGIFGTTATVTNAGTIAASATSMAGGRALATGIFARTTATVTNSGAITASATGGPGSASAGILAFSGTAVVNSGLIKGGAGIVAGGGAGSTIVNSGTIIGTSGTAIDLSGTSAAAVALASAFHQTASSSSNDTLTFLPGSRVVGAILLGTADTVNVQIAAGRGVSSLLGFGDATGANGITATGSTLNFTSGNPLAVSNGTQIATLDPTALALADRSLLDFTGGMSSLVQGRFSEVGESGASGVGGAMRASYAAEPDRANLPFKAPHAAGFDPSTVVWANGFGGGRLQNADGPDLRATNAYSGAALGLDRQVWSNLRLGAFFGGGFGRLDVDQNSQRIDTDYVAGGLYGQYTLGARFLDFTLFGGTTHNASTRQVFDNLAAGGLDTATASYNGRFLSPELAYGWHIPAAGAWTWTPTARLRYVAGWFDGFTESGSAQNLTVNARTVQDLEGKLELALATTQPFGAAQLGLQLKGGVIGLTRLGDRTIDVNLIGQGLSFTTSGRDNAVGVFSGVQFDYKIKQNVNAFVSVEGQALSDSSLVGAARGGIEIRF